MKFRKGIVVDVDGTFGEVKFSDLGREHFVVDENGGVTNQVERRTYDLKSKEQGGIIEVNLAGDVPLKDFPYDSEVELINPKVRFFPNGREVKSYTVAEDIILKNKETKPQPQQQPQKKQG